MLFRKGLSSSRKTSRVKKKLWSKFDYSFKNIKNIESLKMTSKVLYELLIRSFERFKYFSQTSNLTIAKNTNLDQRKSKHHT